MKTFKWKGTGKTANSELDMQSLVDAIPEGGTPTPQDLAEVIKGSDTVVVDIAEDNNSLNIHLDNEVNNKINNSLQAPTEAPTATELVGIGTNKGQVNIGIGSGFEMLNQILNVKVYIHNVGFQATPDSAYKIGKFAIQFYSTSKEKITTKDQLKSKITFAPCITMEETKPTATSTLFFTSYYAGNIIGYYISGENQTLYSTPVDESSFELLNDYVDVI